MSDWAKQVTLAIGLFVVPPIIIVFMVLSWPYPVPGGDGRILPSPLFSWLNGGKGFGFGLNTSPDFRIFLVVVFSGALGAAIHAMQSFSSYVGNNEFRGTWFWWYVLRLPIGSLLALAAYLALRGGLLTTDMSDGATLKGVNVFGVAALAVMAGLFSRQAIDKLKEVFDVVFRSRENNQRTGQLNALTGFTIDPSEVKARTTPPPPIYIRGNLMGQFTVTFDDQVRPAERSPDDTTLTLRLTDADIAQPGEHKIVVKDAVGNQSDPLVFKVVA